MRALRRIPRSLVVAGTILVAGAALAAFLRSGSPRDPRSVGDAAPKPAPRSPEGAPQPEAVVDPAPGAIASPAGSWDDDRIRSVVDLRSATVEEGRLVQRLPGGEAIEFAIDVDAQAAVQRLFDKYDVPVGAAVAIEVATGRVVVFASRTRVPVERDPCVDASPPAASIFKLVTTAALVEDAGVGVDARACYKGVLGVKRFDLSELDAAREEGEEGIACATIPDAFARSLNPVFGRLADRHLSARVLLRRAERFVFGRAIPFDLPLDVSPLEIPTDRLEFARTASGFWHVGLSPLHAAAIAQAIGNGGRMLQPRLVDRIVGPDGAEAFRAVPRLLRSVVEADTAETLRRMMLGTIESGTARKDFLDPQGRPFLKCPVAGKTGSLVNPSPYLSYSWFVGFAPATAGGPPDAADTPAFAVAALVVNEERWRIKAALVAREVLRSLIATPGSDSGSN